MTTTVVAAVAREGSPEFSVEELRLEPPRADEVLVRFLASSVRAADRSGPKQPEVTLQPRAALP
jgi:Zn-dependent alcohol dehydrogenase